MTTQNDKDRARKEMLDAPTRFGLNQLIRQHWGLFSYPERLAIWSAWEEKHAEIKLGLDGRFIETED